MYYFPLSRQTTILTRRNTSKRQLTQAERETISVRTREALAEAKRRGVQLGNPRFAEVRCTDTCAANAARSAAARRYRARMREVIAEVEEEFGRPMSLSEAAYLLDALGHATPRGKTFTATQVKRIRNSAESDAEAEEQEWKKRQLILDLGNEDHS